MKKIIIKILTSDSNLNFAMSSLDEIRGKLDEYGLTETTFYKATDVGNYLVIVDSDSTTLIWTIKRLLNIFSEKKKSKIFF